MGRRFVSAARQVRSPAEGARAPGRDGPAVCEVRHVENAAMMQLRRGEYHAFSGGDSRFLYLVPSAAVVRIDDVSQAVLDTLADGDRSTGELTDTLATRWSPDDVRASIDELLGM